MVEVTGEECSGNRRQFWEHPDQLLKCQVDDGTEDRAHAEKFHCHHWYEDQGCCACTVDTINLAIFSDEPELDDKTLEIAIATMEAYLLFGNAMQWPGMSPAEEIHLKTRINKGLTKLKSIQLAR